MPFCNNNVKRHVGLGTIFISCHFQPPEALQELNYDFQFTDILCRSRVQPILGKECRPDSRKRRKSSLSRAGGNDKKKKKTETETANCCKISQCIDDNVAALDGWQSEDVGSKVSRNIKYKTSGTQCGVQATARNTPMVSAVRYVNCSQRAVFVT